EGTDASTMRGRGWPSLRQFCVFLENRVGRLHDLLRHMERHDLRVIGLSVVDSVDYCVIRIILHDVDRAREVFELSKFTVIENDILGVVLPDSDQPFIEIFLAPMATAFESIRRRLRAVRPHQRRAFHLSQIDQLETRILPTATVSFTGTLLTITGDTSGNEVLVERVGTQLHVAGENATVINVLG